MATPSLAPSSQVHARAVMKAALEAVYAGVWVALAELPAGKQRIARASIVAAALAVGTLADRNGRGGDTEQPAQGSGPESPASQDEPEETDRPPSMTEEDKRRLAKKLVLAITTGTVLSVARRQLRSRWLTGLAAAGHPHPHRALAVRMGVLTFVVSLARHVFTAVESRRESGTSRPKA